MSQSMRVLLPSYLSRDLNHPYHSVKRIILYSRMYQKTWRKLYRRRANGIPAIQYRHRKLESNHQGPRSNTRHQVQEDERMLLS
jgi:hypothetical protein